VDVPVYFTVQPGGAYITPAGAQIVYPNFRNLPAGVRADFWDYDVEDGWHIYGHGTVTPDGRQVVPDGRTRIYEFSGAMYESNASVPPPTSGPPPGGAPGGGDPVDLATGLFTYKMTDLHLDDTMPINIMRTYRPNDAGPRPFGRGTTFQYQ